MIADTVLLYSGYRIPHNAIAVSAAFIIVNYCLGQTRGHVHRLMESGVVRWVLGYGAVGFSLLSCPVAAGRTYFVTHPVTQHPFTDPPKLIICDLLCGR